MNPLEGLIANLGNVTGTGRNTPWWNWFNPPPPVIDGQGTGFIPPRRKQLRLPYPTPAVNPRPFPQPMYAANRNWLGFPMQGG